MIIRQIPLAFVSARHLLTWREVAVGLRERWLKPSDAIALAVGRVQNGDEDPSVVELACVFEDQPDRARIAVEQLAERHPGCSEKEARLTWMRVLLAWLFENRGALPDPLGAVEEIYADFSYPDEIRHLVRFNPTDDAGESSEQRLVELWANYLASAFSP